MPRQLPWANKGAGSRTKVKPAAARQATKPRAATAIDDDFFDDTVLGSSSKGKGRARESDDDLPDLTADPCTPRTKIKTKDALRSQRAQSSSPPPVSGDLEPPKFERMHKAVSKFDLRDEEWMMVEDEHLETAKLFTRHLHMAEYERMKATIETKKNQAGIARPVVPNAKLSINGAMKEKTKVQEQKQKKAIRDVFASQDDEEDEEEEETRIPDRTSFSKTTSSSSVEKRAPPATIKRSAAQDSDSEDLDAPRLPSRSALRLTATPTPAPTHNTAERSQSASSYAPNTEDSGVAFAKPSQPSAAPKPRSRVSRATPFDMLDDWVPKKTQSASKPSPDQQASRASQPVNSSPRPTSPIEPSRTPASSKASRSFDSFDNPGSGKVARATSSFADLPSTKSRGDGVKKDVTDSLAKRKADRDNDDKEKKRKTAKLDDIPTFLF
jgi:hypothetical protein